MINGAFALSFKSSMRSGVNSCRNQVERSFFIQKVKRFYQTKIKSLYLCAYGPTSPVEQTAYVIQVESGHCGNSVC